MTDGHDAPQDVVPNITSISPNSTSVLPNSKPFLLFVLGYDDGRIRGSHQELILWVLPEWQKSAVASLCCPCVLKSDLEFILTYCIMFMDKIYL